MPIIDGWLSSATALPSPNFNSRPLGSEISLIVIHNISLPPAQFGTGAIEQFFLNQLNPEDHPYFQTIANLQVSAHLLIDRKGEVKQFVSFNQRAWHAGVSCYLGKAQCNDFSIGIELEGTDDTPYTEAQYATLATVVTEIQQAYPTTKNALAGHSDIAFGRKTDPGPYFDWVRFRQTLNSL